jgi:alkyl hydroperoxide reductase subunit AhpC
MTIRINDTVPDFSAETDHGSIQFHDWIGDQWAILFSHPKDFTPVCTTEFSAVAQLADQWQALNTKVIGLSVDGVEQHVGWKKDIQAFGAAAAEFPIIADHDLRISKLFDMLPADAYLPDGRTAADSASVRSVFIISPNKKLQLAMTYPMTVGRNFAEILRALKALQKTFGQPIATPADWTEGQDVVIALSLNDEAAKQKFGAFNAKLPYVRMTADR